MNLNKENFSSLSASVQHCVLFLLFVKEDCWGPVL